MCVNSIFFISDNGFVNSVAYQNLLWAFVNLLRFWVEIVGSEAYVFENLQLPIENQFANFRLLLICEWNLMQIFVKWICCLVLKIIFCFCYLHLSMQICK